VGWGKRLAHETINAASTRSTPGQSRAFAGNCRSSTSFRNRPRTSMVAPLSRTSTARPFVTSTTFTPSRPSRSTTRARSTHTTPGATSSDTSPPASTSMASVVSIRAPFSRVRAVEESFKKSPGRCLAHFS
jgi:hypothetical protein